VCLAGDEVADLFDGDGIDRRPFSFSQPFVDADDLAFNLLQVFKPLSR
jgi:hypothetical protein